ncbi:MAG: hypothetical protein IPG23_11220 [Burkholderiales bacterium]|nr:hypothetical protein [Burkholderiales bacterium]
MFENDARLRELGIKAVQGQMSDEEFAELAQLSRAKQQARAERTKLISELQASLRSQGVTIQELYTVAEITAAARNSGEGLGLRVAGPKQAVKPPSATPRTWVRQKTGLTLLQINKPGIQGLPCRYCKGQLLARYVPASLKQLDDGNLEANLEPHYTEEGRQYFATDDGRAELARLVQYVRNGKVKPKP